MAKMIINGEVCSGSSSYASAVEYIKEDGSKSTVQDELAELNSNIAWKELQYVVGNTKITLPNDFEEIYITVKHSNGWHCSIIIPRYILESDIKYFMCGSVTIEAQIYASLSSIIVTRVSYNNVEENTEAYTVYTLYR